MLLSKQLKKHYAPEDAAKAHNIVIELSDARRPRLTTRDTKIMVNVTVHSMLDDLADNENVIATTAREMPPYDKNPAVKKQGISTPLKVFHTHTVAAESYFW